MKRTILALLLLCLPMAVAADTIHVPADQPTIQAGIDAAVDGDTVLVADGTYTGTGNKNLDFVGKAITVQSENGAENCIIDCGGAGRGVYFHNGESPDSVLQGFTIQNGDRNGDNDPYNYCGAGIYCVDSSPTITQNTIVDNSAGFGGGIYCDSGSSPTITGNMVTSNSAFGYLYVPPFPPAISKPGGAGGGIHCDGGSPALVNNIISGNSAVYETWVFGPPTYYTGEGGGIFCSESNTTITNNLIIGNSTGSDGSGCGICCLGGSSLTITNCTLTGHQSYYFGMIYCEDSSLVITNTIIWENQAWPIGEYGSSDVTVTYSDFQGGWTGEGNIDEDPLFRTDSLGDYYLIQVAAGQMVDSPCVDAGNPGSPMIEGTTRTDKIEDDGVVDMGYHYPLMYQPYLWLSPSNLAFTANPQGFNPPDQTFSIINIGVDTFNYEITEAVDWLDVISLTGGPVPPTATILVSVDIAGLGIGTYEGDLMVTAPDALESPQVVHVSLNIAEGDGLFYPAVQYRAGDSPKCAAMGDLDGDGDLDLVLANERSDNVSVLLGNGDGTFQTATHFGAGVEPLSVALGDLDGDGDPDLAVANRASDDVSVLLGNGDGTFQAEVRYEVGYYPWSVAIGDLDGDNDQDLVVANGHGVVVLPGNGDGTFQDPTSYEAGSGARSVAIGNLYGSQAPDLAVANFYSDDVSLLLGNGDGTFQTATNYGAGEEPLSVTIGDLDGDGDQDLAVANHASDAVCVLLNGQLSGLQYGAGNGPRSVAISDLDRDSHPDLAVANEDSDDVTVLVGTGNDTFHEAISYRTGEDPYSVAIGDLNGDGYPDLAVANAGSDNVSVLIHTTLKTVHADLTCQPISGTLPFDTAMSVTLDNLYGGQIRRIAAQIDATLAGGTSFPGWRTGYTNVAAGSSYLTNWVQNIPALGSVIGENLFSLVIEDVTPAPYNQPPYPQAGDTAIATCTVTGISP